eukprot:9247446-Pyramimonas_sp.AAC.1
MCAPRSALITAYGKSGRLSGALAAMKQMEGEGVAANTFTYSALIAACAQAGQWRAALEVRILHTSRPLPHFFGNR